MPLLEEHSSGRVRSAYRQVQILMVARETRRGQSSQPRDFRNRPFFFGMVRRRSVVDAGGILLLPRCCAAERKASPSPRRSRLSSSRSTSPCRPPSADLFFFGQNLGARRRRNADGRDAKATYRRVSSRPIRCPSRPPRRSPLAARHPPRKKKDPHSGRRQAEPRRSHAALQ